MGNQQCAATLINGKTVTFEPFSFAAGEYRRAYKGIYASGPKRGKACVVKIYKQRYALKQSIETELQIASTAVELAKKFNKERISKRKLIFMMPTEGHVESVPCCARGVRPGDVSIPFISSIFFSLWKSPA